jgi:CDP-glycerol glycerophosphotransferase
VNTSAVGEEEVKYSVDGGGYIRSLSKSMRDGLGEVVGINYVASRDKAVLMRHLNRCRNSDYFERGIQTAIDACEMRVHAVDISAFAAVEVDFEEDLIVANRVHGR